jgi:hypothetical protein
MNMQFRPAAVPTTSSMLALALLIATSAGCASSPPAPSPPPRADALDGVRNIVVVASGESRFSVAPRGNQGPGAEFDQIMKWLPYKEILVPLAHAVYWGVSWLMETTRASSTVPSDVAPAAVVADAFTRSLDGRGPFTRVVATNREPVGDARRSADAILRVTVPSWGVVGVRESTAQMVAAFADVRAQIVVPETGVVVWEHEEDVTHPEQLPLQALTADRALARDQLVGVLKRAGRRLANELVYVRSGRS